MSNITRILIAILSILCIMEAGYIVELRMAYQEDMLRDDVVNNEKLKWENEKVVATGDYFQIVNGTTERFSGDVKSVTIKSSGTFLTIYNSSTNTVYWTVPSEGVVVLRKTHKNNLVKP